MAPPPRTISRCRCRKRPGTPTRAARCRRPRRPRRSRAKRNRCNCRPRACRTGHRPPSTPDGDLRRIVRAHHQHLGLHTPGTYPITITGTGDKVTRSTTFTLTVNGTTPTGCQGYETTKTGDLTTGRSDYQPDGAYFYTGTTGRHQACLDGPAGPTTTSTSRNGPAYAGAPSPNPPPPNPTKNSPTTAPAAATATASTPTPATAPTPSATTPLIPAQESRSWSVEPDQGLSSLSSKACSGTLVRPCFALRAAGDTGGPDHRRCGRDDGAGRFGALLKHWRRRAGMSQTRLAAELGYHNSVISRWETGARQPPLDLVQRIDTVLATGGRLAQLYTETGLSGGAADGLSVSGPACRCRAVPKRRQVPSRPGIARSGRPGCRTTASNARCPAPRLHGPSRRSGGRDVRDVHR